MKLINRLIFLGLLISTPACAQEDAWSYMDTDVHPGEQVKAKESEIKTAIDSTKSPEDNDPLEGLNRSIFWFNSTLDYLLVERIAEMYRGVVPQYGRERVGYVLRNLSEPVVLANNILQGEIEDAGITIGRFLINSTIGLAGIFDVSTDLGLTYKKEDFGLTLAHWGIGEGPYLVLPILGPSNIRDTFGRIGDYAFDPINWWSYLADEAVICNSRSGAQILDAKTDNLDLLKELRKSSIDEYATIRTWYHERRKDLLIRDEDRRSIDSPRPDDDD